MGVNGACLCSGVEEDRVNITERERTGGRGLLCGRCACGGGMCALRRGEGKENDT